MRYNRTEKGKARYVRYNQTHREERRATWRASNQRRSEQQKEWARLNRDKRRATEQRYRENHPEKYKSICRESNRQKRALRKTDPTARLAHQLREYVRKHLKRKGRGQRALQLIGCTMEELKRHLESQFQPGMTWDNWAFDGWHIDHIRPLASFDLGQSEQVKAAFHFTNLQPLWAGQNLSKGAKLLPQLN